MARWAGRWGALLLLLLRGCCTTTAPAAGTDVEGAYGFGSTQNKATPHSVYEMSLPVLPGRFGIQLGDPLTPVIYLKLRILVLAHGPVMGAG